MPPMWSAPVAGDGRLRARRWGRWACAGAAVGARRARRARVRSAGVMGSVSWPGRGARATSPASQACCGVMRPGRPWWGRWVLQGVVEAVDPSPGGSATQSARGCRPGWRSGVWPRRSLSPVGGGSAGALPAGGSTPGERTCPTRRPVTGRRLGPGAAPLSAARAPGARPGRPRPCRRRRWPPGRPSPGATSQATARRQWSSWSRPGHRPCARRPGRTRRHPGPPAGVGGGAGRIGATPPSVSWTVRPWPPPPDGRSWPGTPARAPQGPWRPSCRAR